LVLGRNGEITTGWLADPAPNFKLYRNRTSSACFPACELTGQWTTQLNKLSALTDKESSYRHEEIRGQFTANHQPDANGRGLNEIHRPG